MDASFRWALGAAATLLAMHLIATGQHGFVLPDTLRAKVGASPETTLTRPWALFTGPFFHDGFPHLAYNLTVLLLTLPLALEAVGPIRGLAAAYLTSPLAAALVNLALILPLAAAGLGYAQAAVDPRLVGASIVIFAGAGMALGTRGWAGGTVALVAGGYLAYEAILAGLGVTRPFVGVYHGTGFLLGLLQAATWLDGGAA